MDVYFIVLKLPGSTELKFNNGNSPENFWKTVLAALNEGAANVVSVRNDTGVSEEIRKHFGSEFETYVLFYQLLAHHEAENENLILEKAKDLIKIANYEHLIDASENFQLVTIDYLDYNENAEASGNPLLSA